jgi:hypothetical protein
MATPVTGLDANIRQLLDQQNELLKRVAALEKPQKDIWDKLGALSGLLIALVGGYFSYMYSSQQSRQSLISEGHQTRLEEIQTVGTFTPFLVGTDDTARSIALAEVEQLPNQQTVIAIAEHVSLDKIAKGDPNGEPGALKFLENAANNAATPAFKKMANEALTKIHAAQATLKR